MARTEDSPRPPSPDPADSGGRAGDSPGRPGGDAGDIRVGVAGWSYADWRGRFYPQRRDPTPDLARVARLFDCVEINVTFYRHIEPRVAAKWLHDIQDHPQFLFTTKVPKELTHGKDLEPADLSSGARRLVEGLAPLIEANRLAAVLLQFPFYFRDSPESRDRIRILNDALRPLPVNVELRHPGFFFGPLRRDPVKAAGPGGPIEPPRALLTGPGSALHFLEGIGAGICNIDIPPGRGAVPATSINTTGLGYVRLHGRNSRAWFDPRAGRDAKYDYLYTRQELSEWADRIRKLGQRTIRTFVIANNHFRGQAPANALEVMRLLGRAVPQPPPELLRAFPDLAGFLGRPAPEAAGGHG